jgi:hypothetical protein
MAGYLPYSEFIWGASEMLSSPGCFLRGLNHRFLHAIFSRPIQANLVAIGIIEISMSPAPGHHAWQFGDIEVFFLELAAELVEFSDFEVQAHTIARNGIPRTHLMQSDRPIPTRRAQARIHRPIFVAEVFDELESQQIAVEDKPPLHVLNVDHGMIESKLSFSV